MTKNPMLHVVWIMLGGSLLSLLFFGVYLLSLAGWWSLGIGAFAGASWIVGRRVWQSWEAPQ